MKTQSYDVFWQRIHRSAQTKGFPLRVMFELTYRCNFNCAHCYVPKGYKERPELKTKEVFAILDQLKSIGCFYLGFTGGEMFARQDIMDILWYAKRKGFELILYTNGSLIDKRIADELIRLRPNKIDITIPGMSREVFDKLVGAKGARDKVFKAIELLHKNGVPLGFKTCLLKGNEGEIEEIQKFARSLGALHRLDDTLSARLDGSEEPFEFRGQIDGADNEPDKSAEECSSPNNEILRLRSSALPRSSAQEEGVKTIKNSPTPHLFKCGVGISQAAITPAGELKMCVMIDHPRYEILAGGGKGLERAWKRLTELVRSIQPDESYQCGTCDLEPYCKWCPARGWLYRKDFNVCEPRSRQKAREVQKIVTREFLREKKI